MNENLKHLKPIQITMVLALLVLLSILTTQTLSIAKNYALVPQTGQTQSYASGDDGDLQKGLQWPDPRFTDNGNGTVTDKLTGLIWLKNADCFGDKNWNNALDACNNLANGQCGLSDGSSPGDWRLSNVREILSLIDYDNIIPPLPTGHPFANVRSGGEPSSSYWSSTTVANRTIAACLVLMDPGVEVALMDDAPKDQSSRGLWPVRCEKEEAFPWLLFYPAFIKKIRKFHLLLLLLKNQTVKNFPFMFLIESPM